MAQHTHSKNPQMLSQPTRQACLKGLYNLLKNTGRTSLFPVDDILQTFPQTGRSRAPAEEEQGTGFIREEQSHWRRTLPQYLLLPRLVRSLGYIVRLLHPLLASTSIILFSGLEEGVIHVSHGVLCAFLLAFPFHEKQSSLAAFRNEEGWV